MLASVDGQLLSMPIKLATVNRLYGLQLTAFQMDGFLAPVAELTEPVLSSEDVVVNRVGRDPLTGQAHAQTSLVYEHPRADGATRTTRCPGRRTPPCFVATRPTPSSARTSPSSAGWPATSTTTWTGWWARHWPPTGGWPPGGWLPGGRVAGASAGAA